MDSHGSEGATGVAQGSMWRKNPIPRGSWEWPNSGNSFDPVCDESDECKGYSDLKAKQSRGACRCSGTSTRYETQWRPAHRLP